MASMAGRTVRQDPITASAAEAIALQRVKRALPSRPREARLISAGGKLSPIPASLYRVLREAITHLSRGDAVVLQPVPAKLTLAQAAGLLNVPAHFVEKEIEAGALPSHTTGSRQHVALRDLLAYKRRRDARRRAALRRLSRESQRLGIYE
jgi:excisionase family DNA binding protein